MKSKSKSKRTIFLSYSLEHCFYLLGTESAVSELPVTTLHNYFEIGIKPYNPITRTC